MKPRHINQYKIENEAFLEQKSQEEGVLTLNGGITMKCLRKGEGNVSPSLNGIVYVHYTGRLIDGTVFDTTEGEQLPALFHIRELIEGWQIALTRMHAGDRYEVCLPAGYGYGSRKVDGIPAHSTLVFDMELVSVER
ncbi:MAG: FKBP-type peptidyl-prolyl cis-trans isomerase [Bacteroides sp.]|nr:FKBP-type peptidyl-prolyl cis-trans isomerase [Bacteroides sp.]